MSACLKGHLPFDTGQTEREKWEASQSPYTVSSLVCAGVNHGLRVHAGGGNLAFHLEVTFKDVDPCLWKLALITHSFVWVDCCVYSVQGPLFLLIYEKILWHHHCKFHLFLILCSGSSSGKVGFMGSYTGSYRGSFTPLDSPSSSLVSTLYTCISCFLPPCSFVISLAVVEYYFS